MGFICIFRGITIHEPALLGYQPGTRVLTQNHILLSKESCGTKGFPES